MHFTVGIVDGIKISPNRAHLRRHEQVVVGYVGQAARVLPVFKSREYAPH